MRISIWLMPEESSFAALTILINQFSLRFGTPSFSPHVTICSGTVVELDALGKELTSYCSTTGVHSMITNGLKQSDVRFQCVYILMRSTEKLHQLRQLVMPFLQDSPDQAEPHISLGYACIEETARYDFLREIKFDTFYRFDRIALVSLSDEWSNVERWDIVEYYHLRNIS